MPQRSCAICGDPEDHHGAAHSDVTGDGQTRASKQLQAVFDLHTPIHSAVPSAYCTEHSSDPDHEHGPDCVEQVSVCNGCSVRFEQCMTRRAIARALYTRPASCTGPC